MGVTMGGAEMVPPSRNYVSSFMFDCFFFLGELNCSVDTIMIRIQRKMIPAVVAVVAVLKSEYSVLQLLQCKEVYPSMSCATVVI